MWRLANTLKAASSVLVLSQFAPQSAASGEADWTRVYVGGHIGYDWSDFGKLDVGSFQNINGGPPATYFSPDLDGAVQTVGGPAFTRHESDSVIGGALAGWNFVQSGPVVFGVEGDVNWTGAHAKTTGVEHTELFHSVNPALSFRGVFDETREQTAEAEWKATLRGRAGLLATDKLLLFATGGVAWGDINATQSNALTGELFESFEEFPPELLNSFDQASSGKDSKIHVGFVVGGGADWRLTDRVTARVEGLYFDLGSESYNFGEAGRANIDVQETVVRSALTFNLN
jgi:outer membrane immunogenic protein